MPFYAYCLTNEDIKIILTIDEITMNDEPT